MKMAIYSCREDEEELFYQFSKQHGVEIVTTRERPALKNASLAEGCDGISVITTPVDKTLVEEFHKYQIKIISTRTIGYEHIDYNRAAELGITVSNVNYSANTVAEYTVMCMLMAIRKMKTILIRSMGQDYSLKHIRGRELQHMTVGVIGTGRIGEALIPILHGFGCRILAYDKYQKNSVKEYGDYVTLDSIWRECDMISLHIPGSKDSDYLIGRRTLEQMKQGVILVNTARGSLVDSKALIEAVETGKVGAAVLDVLDGESQIYYRDLKQKTVSHHDLAILQSFPNVLLTPHTAFFTEEAVSDMIEYSILSCLKTVSGEKNPWKIN